MKPTGLVNYISIIKPHIINQIKRKRYIVKLKIMNMP